MVARLLIALLLLAGSARAEGGVLLLVSPEGGPIESQLLDELRIYTRDLGRVVRTGGQAPVHVSASELSRLAEEGRAAQVEVVVWTSGHGADAVLLALRLATMDLRETVIGDEEVRSAARVLALKVRALLTSPTAPSPWREVTAEEVERREAEAKRQETPPVQPPSPVVTPALTPTPPAVVVPRPALEVRREAPAARRRWLELAVGYRLALPLDPTWTHHLLEVRIGVPLGAWPLAVEADFAFGPSAKNQQGTTQLWLRDVPIGLALAAGLTRGRWNFSLAARAALHVVDAEASTSDGRHGQAQRLGVGLGLRGEVRLSIVPRLLAYLSVAGEGMALQQAFTLDGASGPDPGSALFSASAGLRSAFP